MTKRIAQWIIAIIALGVVFGVAVYISRGDATIGVTLGGADSGTSLSDGLIGHWTFDGEDMDTNVADISGNGNHGYLQGQSSTTTTSGAIGQGLEFDGSDDYVEVTGLMGEPANISLCGWGKIDSTSKEADFISLGDSVALRFHNTATGGTVRPFFYNGSTWRGLNSGENVSGTGWRHACYTFDDTNDTQTLYIDGSVATTSVYAESISYTLGSNTIIGGHGNGGGSTYYFEGSIDDPRIYDRVISADEVKRLYQLGGTTKINQTINQTGTIFADSLVGHWSFDGPDVIGSTVIDSGLGGNDGTMNAISYGDGADGSITLSSSKNINTNTIAGGRSYADGIAYRVNAPSDGASSVTRYSGTDTLSNGIAAGDEVLLINLQGTSGDNADVGNYEIMEVDSVSASTITFTEAITVSFDGSVAGNQKVVVQRVPNYTSVTISTGGTLTAGAWDGLSTTPTGSAGYYTGIIAFKASGTVSIASGTSINVSELGYRGPTASCSGGSDQGESYTGTGSKSTAANAGGGGGGDAGTNEEAGGGGGGYGTAGATGEVVANTPGTGGSTYGNSALTDLFLGSAGGAGAGSGGNCGGDGGDGGGVVYIEADTISNSGSINATGGAGGNGSSSNKGGGGGGAGGSIFLKAYSVTVGTADATAGAAGFGGGSGGDGGIGGDGRIRIESSSISGTASPAASTADLGTSTSVPGRIGQAMEFDGVDDYVDMGDVLDQGTSDFSITTWVYPKSSGSDMEIINKKDAGVTTLGYGIRIKTNDLVQIALGDGTNNINSSFTGGEITRNSWNHITVIFDDSGNADYYLNGSFVSSIDITSVGDIDSTTSLRLGRRDSGNYYKGKIDDLRVYNRALTADEVERVYHLGATTKISTTVPDTGERGDGLVGHWTFDGKDLYNNIADVSGQGNTGYLELGASGNTSTTTAIGKLGQALEFDGVDDHVDVGDRNDMSTSDFTLSAWIRVSEPSLSQRIINKRDTRNVGYEMYIEDDANDLHMFLGDLGGIVFGAGNGSLSYNLRDGNWHHVLISFDRSASAHYYIDGQSDGTKDISSRSGSIDNSESLRIGNTRGINGDDAFTGSIDDVRIYNRTLSAAEIRDLYQMGR